MSYPNFRTREQAFGIIYQTLGRAGRDENNGRAIIQTRNPKDPIIQYAANFDYKSFAEHEIKLRKIQNYPPYCGVVGIVISGKKDTEILEFAERIKVLFITLNIANIDILGPSKINSINQILSTNIFIKYKRLKDIQESLFDLIDFYNSQSKVSLKINFNPYNM